MSNHFSAANYAFPGGDARLDLTDLFVFVSPDDTRKTVFIVDVNPLMTAADFNPDAVYRVNVDTDGDLRADIAFSFVFSETKSGMQTATAYYATGSQAREPEAKGEPLIQNTAVGFDSNAKPVQSGACRFFFGVRADPFFADPEGALHGFQFTGKDLFIDKNVLSIAIEVPNDMLGTNPLIGVWMTVSIYRDGTWMQMDRGGQPSMNPFLNPQDAKDEYNARQPVDDVANYLEPWSKFLQDTAGYSAADARAAVLTVLPDILKYNRTLPVSYPNGRKLTDDVFDARVAFLTNGRIKSDGVGPHQDYLAQFPFLGLPHAATTAKQPAF